MTERVQSNFNKSRFLFGGFYSVMLVFALNISC